MLVQRQDFESRLDELFLEDLVLFEQLPGACECSVCVFPRTAKTKVEEAEQQHITQQ